MANGNQQQGIEQRDELRDAGFKSVAKAQDQQIQEAVQQGQPIDRILRQIEFQSAQRQSQNQQLVQVLQSQQELLQQALAGQQQQQQQPQDAPTGGFLSSLVGGRGFRQSLQAGLQSAGRAAGGATNPIQDQIRSLQLQQLQQNRIQNQSSQNLIRAFTGQAGGAQAAQPQGGFTTQAQPVTQQTPGAIQIPGTAQFGVPQKGGPIAARSATVKTPIGSIEFQRLDFEGQKKIFNEQAENSERIRRLSIGLKEVFRGAEQALPGGRRRVPQRVAGVLAGFSAATGIGKFSPKAVAQIKTLKLKVRQVLKNFGEGARMSDQDVIQASEALSQLGLTTPERLALFEDILTFVASQSGQDPEVARAAVSQAVGITTSELEDIITSTDEIDVTKMRKIRRSLGLFRNTQPGKNAQSNVSALSDDQFAQALSRSARK